MVHENSNTGDECGGLIEQCSGRGFESRHLHENPQKPVERRAFRIFGIFGIAVSVAWIA